MPVLIKKVIKKIEKPLEALDFLGGWGCCPLSSLNFLNSETRCSAFCSVLLLLFKYKINSPVYVNNVIEKRIIIMYNINFLLAKNLGIKKKII